MRILVTGGAGFIGRHLVGALRAEGHEVRIIDRARSPEDGPIPEGYFFSGVEVRYLCERALEGVDLVYHLAANTDLRESLTNPTRDFESAEATSVLLECMRAKGVRDIVFASSATVYGPVARESKELYERGAPTEPISLYGASKLYSENMIRAYCEAFGFRAVVMRFGNVVGKERRTGVIWDFLTKLRGTAAEGAPRIEVLGDGNQRKTYIHVDDCVAGLLHTMRVLRVAMGRDNFEIFNLATRGTVGVKFLANYVRAASPYPNAQIVCGYEAQGWKGDVPVCELSPEKLARWGFSARLTGMEAVERVIKEQAAEVFGTGAGTTEAT